MYMTLTATNIEIIVFKVLVGQYVIQSIDILSMTYDSLRRTLRL